MVSPPLDIISATQKGAIAFLSLLVELLDWIIRKETSFITVMRNR